MYEIIYSSNLHHSLLSSSDFFLVCAAVYITEARGQISPQLVAVLCLLGWFLVFSRLGVVYFDEIKCEKSAILLQRFLDSARNFPLTKYPIFCFF